MINYELRGKCKELSEALVTQDPTLRLVRGHYFCPIWGKQEHWWCESPEGKVFDPTKLQFPSGGIGDYVEYDGFVECAQCGERMQEQDAHFEGNYPLCKNTNCAMFFLGLAEFIR